MRILVLLAIFSWAIPARASLSGVAGMVNRGYHEALLRCPEKIWPGLRWDKLQILLGEPGAPFAYLVSAFSQEAWPVAVDSRLAEFFAPGTGFDTLELSGRKTLAINVQGMSGQAALRLAVHELFHEVGQSGWNSRTVDERGSLYPLLAEPRYLRRMAFERLRLAQASLLAGRDPKAMLGMARYWLERWKRWFPEELSMTTDTVEGTARFVELQAAILSETGCEAAGPAYSAAYRRLAAPVLTLPTDASLEVEGYPLGGIASFLLNSLEPGWAARMDGTFQTSDLAVAHSPLRADVDDETLRESYQRETDARGRRLRVLLDPEIARLSSSEFWRISVPASWQHGSFSPEGSFVLRSQRDLTLLTLAQRRRFWGDEGEIHLPGGAVALQTSRDECGGMLFFFVPKERVQQEGKHFRGNWNGREFHFRGTKRATARATWICPRE